MKLLQKDIIAEKLINGGWRLSIMHDARRVTARYFGYSLREAKRMFLADIKAGAL
jgi:hypothetical protein